MCWCCTRLRDCNISNYFYLIHQVSKKRAAELMLEELRKLPALPPTTLVRIKRKPTTKKKSRNLIKVGQEASIPPCITFLFVAFTSGQGADVQRNEYQVHLNLSCCHLHFIAFLSCIFFSILSYDNP